MLYALIYFSFKHYSGGYYPGAQLGHPSLLELLRTIWQFSIGGFIFHYIGHGSYPIFYRDSFDFSKISLIPPFSMVDVFQNTTLVDYTMALTSGVIAAIAARKCSASFSPKGLILTVLAGSLVSVSALVLYSLTDQFPYLVEIGHVAYQPTRYAYFGWCIVLSAAAVAAIRAIGANRTPQFIALAFLAIGTALGSLSASYFNERVAATMRVQTAKWDAVDMAMQCAPFLETADGDDVYAPRLNSVVWWAYIRDKDQYWNTYISNKFHEKQRIFMTVAATPGERVHFLDYRISMSGRVLGVFLAEVAADGKTNVLHVLSKRTDALLILFQEAERQKIAIASWGMHSKSCGEYMVNRIIGNAIDVNLVSMYLPPQIPLNNPINFPD